jgi:hypothetical protein
MDTAGHFILLNVDHAVQQSQVCLRAYPASLDNSLAICNVGTIARGRDVKKRPK